jgi:hypothetical protein
MSPPGYEAEEPPPISTKCSPGLPPVTQNQERERANDSTLGLVSYGPPWAYYLGRYQDRLLGGPLGLPGLRCTALDGVKHKDYKGEVLG